MSTLEVHRAILRAVELGRPGVVATVLRHKGSAPGKEHHKMLFLAGGDRVGTIGGGRMEAKVAEGVAEVLRTGHGKVLELLIADKGEGAIGGVCGGKAIVALELLPEIPRVLLCGGGHCAVELARLCHQLGYLYEVHEDRGEYLEPTRFPEAMARHLGEPDRVVEDLGGHDRFSHVLLVSRGHGTDRLYGRALCRAGYRGWIGMLGSLRKSKVVRAIWIEEDGLPAEWVARLECPVGLPIGATSPAEIAVSILARIVETTRR